MGNSFGRTVWRQLQHTMMIIHWTNAGQCCKLRPTSNRHLVNVSRLLGCSKLINMQLLRTHRLGIIPHLLEQKTVTCKPHNKFASHLASSHTYSSKKLWRVSLITNLLHIWHHPTITRAKELWRVRPITNLLHIWHHPTLTRAKNCDV